MQDKNYDAQYINFVKINALQSAEQKKKRNEKMKSNSADQPVKM